MSKASKREWWDRVKHRPGFIKHLIAVQPRLDAKQARRQYPISNEAVHQELRRQRKLRNAGVYAWDSDIDHTIRDMVERFKP